MLFLKAKLSQHSNQRENATNSYKIFIIFCHLVKDMSLIKKVKISQCLSLGKLEIANKYPVFIWRRKQQQSKRFAIEKKASLLAKFITNQNVYFFSGKSGKNGNNPTQDSFESSNKESKQQQHKSHQPKIIQISKTQLEGMKKFLQDITMSMPMPNMNFGRSPSKRQETEQVQYGQGLKQANPNENEALKQYFSDPEQKLSFMLLKLSSPHQFLPIFQQYKDAKNISMKLIILHRYCSVGGQVGAHGNQVGKLAYNFMSEVLNDLRLLEENQLQQFLELYINLHQEAESNRTHSSKGLKQQHVQLPKIGLEADLLVKNPSHKSTHIIVLLLQFLELQAGGQNSQKDYIQNKKYSQAIIKILNHYSIEVKKQQKSDIEEQTYSIKDLAYIGIVAFQHGLSDYNAINLLVTHLNQLLSVSTVESKQIIQGFQHILLNIHKLSSCPSPTILRQVDLLKTIIIKFITHKLCQQNDPISTQTSTQLDPDTLGNSVQATSGTVYALLYTSLLVLQENTNSLSVEWAGQVLNAILLGISNRKQELGIHEYSQLWKSCSIMYKLINNKQKYKNILLKRNTQGNLLVQARSLLALVNHFLYSTSIQTHVKMTSNPQNGSIIQQHALSLETMLFQCLVAYRMVLPPPLSNSKQTLNSIQQFVNIQRQVDNRRLLSDLLTGFRKVCEQLYECSLVKDSNNPQVHNLLITCMIAQAYPLPPSTNNAIGNGKEATMSRYLLSPTIISILRQLGCPHERYGSYARKVLEKYGQGE